jgi:uncharacterized membrane protein required for colicin V production
MNWSDWAVIGIIGAAALIGLTKGFVKSVFKVLAFFVSAIASIKFYPVVAEMLMKTSLQSTIKTSILKDLLKQKTDFLPQADAQAKQIAADAFITQLRLPGFLKDTLINKIPNPSKIFDLSTILNSVSEELTKLVIGIISFVLLYILIRVALLFVRAILEGIAKLPLFKQIDKLGGFALGGVEGLLSVYILFAFVMMFSSASWFKNIFDTINTSTIAKFFYQNNFIVNWLFPK